MFRSRSQIGLARSDSGLISWSPDSRRLTFAAARAADRTSLSHIYVAEAGRHGAVAIGTPELVGIEPAWSPDGDRIAFKTLGFDQALWLVNADGSNAHRLTHVLGGGYSFWNAQWSSDGTRLLFVAGIDGTYDVWTINADGTDERNISMSKEDEYWPSWSPDGERIAFVRISAEGHGSVVIVNADGSEPVVLPGPSMNSNMPIWSPDGTKLFGPAADTSSPTIVVYDLVHGTPRLSPACG